LLYLISINKLPNKKPMTFYIIIAAIALGIFFLFRFLRNVQPDDFEVANDLKALKKSVAEFKGGLEKWEKGISAADIDQVVEKSNQRSGKGVFMSPEGSPVFAYAFRNYIGPLKNNVIYVLTYDHEYIFRSTSKGTEITIDGNKAGMYRYNGNLYDARNNEIAQIKRNSMTGINSLMINNNEVAKIALPENLGKIEAVEITGQNLKPEQMETIKTLSILELISSQDGLKD
jgi:hypothetical protein